MPSYKLRHFNARGFGEMIRLLFVEKGVAYEDLRHTLEEWPEHKPSRLCYNFCIFVQIKGNKLNLFIITAITWDLSGRTRRPVPLIF